MSWSKFGVGFLMVVIATFAKAQITNYWVPIEFSIFLIFFIIRSSNVTRALLMTFVLTLGMDFIFQAGQVKGLETMGQLVLVFFVVNLKKHVIPQFEDVFLMGFFAVFFIANYYITLVLSKLLGVYVETVAPMLILFFALFHTAFFGLLLAIGHKFGRGRT